MADETPKPSKASVFAGDVVKVTLALGFAFGVCYLIGRYVGIIDPPQPSIAAVSPPPVYAPPPQAPPATQRRPAAPTQQGQPRPTQPQSRTVEQVRGLNASNCATLYPGARWVTRPDGSGFCYRRVVRQ